MDVIRVDLRLRTHRVRLYPIVLTTFERGVYDLPLRQLQAVYPAQLAEIVVRSVCRNVLLVEISYISFLHA